MKPPLFILATLIIVFISQKSNAQMNPVKWPGIPAPLPVKKTHTRDIHGDKVNDYYYWMIDYFKKGPDSAEVVQYLEAENKYLGEMMADTRNLQDTLYKEMRGRIKEQDDVVANFKNGYYDHRRQEAGKHYCKLSRKKGRLTAPEEILLVVVAMEDKHPYYAVAGVSVKTDNQRLVLRKDTLNRR